MKKGDILEAKILRTDFPNRGITFIDEETVTIKNGLSGQKVRFFVRKKKRGKVEGQLMEVLEKAPCEIEPPCLHFGACGGCSYQNLPYEEQLRLKKEQVERLIETNGLGFSIEEILSGPVREGYRNKMEFTFGDEVKDGPLALGMHRRGSFYDIVSLTDCRIADKDFNTLVRHILKYFKEKGSSFYHRLRHEGFLRHLVLRRSAKTGEILINLVTSGQDSLDEESFVKNILAVKEAGEIDGRIAGILHTINDSVADVVKSDETRLLYGRDYIYEYLYNLRFRISPFSFFQTNTLGAEVLYDKVREYVGDTKDKLIYDLYTGTGTIAQLLAPVAKKVVGVEIVEEAVEAARQNAKDNQLDNCEFIAGDVLKVVDELTEKPDILVLDPPRDGIHPKALKKIIGFGVKEIVYVSCKPTSLMRDLLVFREEGYEVKRASMVDMFPGTVHVETVCALSKLSEAKHHISVQVDMDELDLTAAESKATYEEIQEWVKEKYGFHVTHLNIAKTKQKCGIIERQNYNLPKSENSRSPDTPKEKEEAIIDAFLHFKMM